MHQYIVDGCSGRSGNVLVGVGIGIGDGGWCDVVSTICNGDGEGGDNTVKNVASFIVKMM
jgi:hypothetical protein